MTQKELSEIQFSNSVGMKGHSNNLPEYKMKKNAFKEVLHNIFPNNCFTHLQPSNIKALKKYGKNVPFFYFLMSHHTMGRLKWEKLYHSNPERYKWNNVCDMTGTAYFFQQLFIGKWF